MEKRGIFIFILLFLVLITNGINAQTTENLSVEQNAINCLNEANQIRTRLNDSGFNTSRITDLIGKANDFYNTQTILKTQGKKYDLSPVLDYCTDLEKIESLAYSSRDEFSVLKKFYNVTVTPLMDTIKIDEILDRIQNEIDSERYEKVEPLIKEGYDEISSLQATYTTLNVFYENTRKGVLVFFQRNWKIMLSILVILVILLIIYWTTIRKRIIQGKIDKLIHKKEVLNDLIKNAQRTYFESGKMPEATYNIKTKKFAEMIRDIDRQIPLLQEELLKLKRNKENAKTNNPKKRK